MKTILDQLELTAQRYTDETAVDDGMTALSWKEFIKLCRQSGSAYLPYIAHKEPVAVFAEKSTQTLAAMLGAVYAGGFYVSINPEQPAARAGRILEQRRRETRGRLGEPGATFPQNRKRALRKPHARRALGQGLRMVPGRANLPAGAFLVPGPGHRLLVEQHRLYPRGFRPGPRTAKPEHSKEQFLVHTERIFPGEAVLRHEGDSQRAGHETAAFRQHLREAFPGHRRRAPSSAPRPENHMRRGCKRMRPGPIPGELLHIARPGADNSDALRRGAHPTRALRAFLAGAASRNRHRNRREARAVFYRQPHAVFYRQSSAVFCKQPRAGPRRQPQEHLPHIACRPGGQTRQKTANPYRDPHLREVHGICAHGRLPALRKCEFSPHPCASNHRIFLLKPPKLPFLSEKRHFLYTALFTGVNKKNTFFSDWPPSNRYLIGTQTLPNPFRLPPLPKGVIFIVIPAL